MLALTPTAMDVVRTITTGQGAPEGAGLRIAAATDESQQGALELSVAARPAEDDQVLSRDGAQIFLDQRAATYLDDKILDAGLDDQGKATFVLGEQSQNNTKP